MPLQQPNFGAAIIQYLKASTDITDPSIAGNKIYIGWPKGDDAIVAPDPTTNKFPNVIIVRLGLGGQGDLGLGQREERFAVRCYGANELQAWNMYLTVNPYLTKPDGNTKSNFVLAHTQVNFILEDGGPIFLLDTTAANWPFVEGTYRINYNGIRV